MRLICPMKSHIMTYFQVVNANFSVLKLGCSRHNNNLTCGAVRLYEGHSVSTPVIKEYLGDYRIVGDTNILSGGQFMTVSLTGYRIVQQSAGFYLNFNGINVTGS